MNITTNSDLINPILSGLHESDTLAINERSKQLVANGKSVFMFGLGQSPFPVPECVVKALRLNAPRKDYLPVKGLLQLRKAVAAFHRQKDNVDADPNNVIIGPGSKELVFLLQMVFNGEIIIISPCWVSYIPQAKILGKKISVIHSSYKDRWQLTPELFRKFLEARAEKDTPSLMILNSPGNPDGVSYEENELKEIAELARAHNVYILSDEIYGQLNHSGKHISIAKFYPEGTIISSGLSKWCGAGGWRLGTFTFPPNLSDILDKMAVVASETYTSVCAPVQHAAIEAFKGGYEIEEYLLNARRILSALGNECVRILREADIRVHAPTGGFYLFLDFSAHAEKLNMHDIHNSMKMCESLLEDTGVAILHGSSFSRPEKEFTARMAYVDFDGARALAMAKTIPFNQPISQDFLEFYCPRVLDGVNAIAGWFKSL